MTSTAEPGTGVAGPSWLRICLIFAALALLALQTPMPWAWLWLAVPGVLAVALLATWRFGMRGAVLAVLLSAVSLVVAGVASLSAWWVPVAAFIGSWMGLREEGGGPPAGERARMLAPALVLAAALPWASRYGGFIKDVNAELLAGDAQFLELLRQFGASGERLGSVHKAVTDNAALRQQALPNVLPTVLFAWVALLTVAGRALAARLARSLRWPRLSRVKLIEWRLPDAALWAFLAGLALLVGPWTRWAPTGWTLLLDTGLGFCVQGIAVVESLLLARGVPPSVIVVTLLFVFLIAMPMFVLTTVAVGLSDVWLDYRRLEPVPDGNQT
ncbi:MAG: DUF2232 domain-containing protein [Candidatus Eisenbacteria bacterium]|nr:DUF2232 domain-containing protein [Candidatus Eisenbacteria bacterium]